VFNDVDTIIQVAEAGLGLGRSMEDEVAGQLARGTLMRVLEDGCARLFPACHRIAADAGSKFISRTGGITI
jgi:hypothetical protein